MSEIRSVKYKNVEIRYTLIRKKVKNINLRIKPDLEVTVSSNYRVSLKVIDEFVLSKAEFILNAMKKISENKQQYVKEFINGEIFFIFGEKKRLTVNKSCKNSIEINDNDIILNVTNTDDTQLKKRVFDEWIKKNSIEKISEICKDIYPMFEPYGIKYPEIRYRKMVSQWGNCRASKGILTFNTYLYTVPEECIEYVVVHEFSHFLYQDHSKDFYDCVARFMPDWKIRREMLKKYKTI